MQVSIINEDVTSGIAYFKYYLNNVEWKTDTVGITTLEGLTPNQTYNLKVVAYDNAGNASKESSTVPIKTKGELQKPSISIASGTMGQNNWYTSNIVLNINDTAEAGKTRAVAIKYSITGGNALGEQTIIGTSSQITINRDGTSTIYAYAVDLEGNRSDAAELTIQRDTTPPTPTLGTPETNSNGTIKVTATANETGGSGVKSYEFQYKTAANGTWTRHGNIINSTASTYTYTYTGMGDGKTVYIRVLVTDGAGNIGKSAEDNANGTSALIPSANTAPTIQSITYSSKTTNSITITARATDNENDALTYKMYTSTDNQNWTEKATSNSVASGTTVTLTASGLSQYTYYYIKVRATETASRSAIPRDNIWKSN